jgi:hypothetical protein
MFLRCAILSAALLAATVAATPPDHLTPANAPTLRTILAPGGSAASSLVSKLQSASGAITDVYQPAPTDFPPPVETSLAVSTAAKPSPAAQCAAGTNPQITHVKGELTSQGYMVVEGVCFGPPGTVVASGFPTGNPVLTVQAWAPGAITVGFPKITGVPDLIMHVSVTHGPGSSGGLTGLGGVAAQLAAQLGTSQFDAKFTAAIGDPVPLTSKYIAMNDCGGAFPICIAAPPATAIGVHVDSALASGADIWTFTIPDHWHLSGVRLVHLSPSAASFSTINGTGAQKTIRIAWSEAAIQQHADSSSSCSPSAISSLGALYGSLMQQFCAANPAVGVLYAANYRVEPMVRGPAGMTLP